MGELGSLKVTIKLSEATILAYKKMCDLAKKCQSKMKGKGGRTVDKFGVDKLIKETLSVPDWKKPLLWNSAVWDKKSGLYLPVSKFNMEIDSAVGYSNYTSASTLPPVTPWSLGVAMLGMELVDAGFYSKRLAEQMYLASRVFEHNLAARARQHGMRVR